MLESIRQYLQDWSDACEYANECAPDLSFLHFSEPYTGLGGIAAACFAVYAWNEWRIKRFGWIDRSFEGVAPAELRAPLEEMENQSSCAEKLAA